MRMWSSVPKVKLVTFSQIQQSSNLGVSNLYSANLLQVVFSFKKIIRGEGLSELFLYTNAGIGFALLRQEGIKVKIENRHAIKFQFLKSPQMKGIARCLVL